MPGRGVGLVIETDADSVFADVRHLIAGADIAAGNLESPLTTLPHDSANENALEADPAAADVLRTAGFDLLSLPNNHTMDAGNEGLSDTIATLESVGIGMVGASSDESASGAPRSYSSAPGSASGSWPSTQPGARTLISRPGKVIHRSTKFGRCVTKWTSS